MKSPYYGRVTAYLIFPKDTPANRRILGRFFALVEQKEKTARLSAPEPPMRQLRQPSS
jgi:hypothetical protein